ncbi:hypothetical protein B0H12DRAFT_679507 [Mycena haematopus]|nr:hypothetical protein B0H12DRAFT_679507 [Mycena haematopus]
MHREDQQRLNESLKRPRDPDGIHSTPPIGSSKTSLRSKGAPAMAKSTNHLRESQAGTQSSDCRGSKPPSVTERSWKRRKIHVVHIVVPEIKIKDEEESPSIALFDSDVDAQMELGSFFWPSLRVPTAEPSQPCCTSLSSFSGQIHWQQHTPPRSPGSATPAALSASSPTSSAEADEQSVPQSTPPRLFSMSLPPSPPASSLSEPTLSWPKGLKDPESYELATASTQELIDHYLRVAESEIGIISLLPLLDE